MIPSSFELMGHTIEVVMDDDTCLGFGALGLTAGNKIELGRKQVLDKQIIQVSQSQLEHTFFHELTHQILIKLGEMELNQNEKFVDSFSGLLHQALKTAKY